MKKSGLILVAVLLGFFAAETVYAESLNEHELAIIEAAKEVYEYNGKSYRVEQKYIDELIKYLSQDNIDVTAEDKEFIIQTAYNSIEIGIREGYLKPAENQDKQEEDEINSEADVTDTIRAVLESVGKDMSDLKEYIPSLTDGSGGDEISDNIEDKVPYTGENGSAGHTGKYADENGFDNDTGQETAAGKKGTENNQIQASDPDINNNRDTYEEDNRMEEGIIKQTGFNLNRTLYIIIGIGILMIVGIVAAVKNNYFAHAYE